MKKVLTTLGLLVVTNGCVPVPEYYVTAAKSFAEETCTGVVTDTTNTTKVGATSERYSVTEGSYLSYSCITEAGTVWSKILYKDVPVKYFKENK